MRKILKLNTFLSLATIMETLLQNLLVSVLLTVLTLFQKYWHSLRRYSISKSSSFAKCFIFVPIVIDIGNLNQNPYNGKFLNIYHT